MQAPSAPANPLSRLCLGARGGAFEADGGGGHVPPVPPPWLRPWLAVPSSPNGTPWVCVSRFFLQCRHYHGNAFAGFARLILVVSSPYFIPITSISSILIENYLSAYVPHGLPAQIWTQIYPSKLEGGGATAPLPPPPPASYAAPVRHCLHGCATTGPVCLPCCRTGPVCHAPCNTDPALSSFCLQCTLNDI